MTDVGPEPAPVVAAVGGIVTAFDLATGREWWRVELETGVASTWALVVVYGRVLACGGYNTDLHCLDLPTGRPFWSVPTTSEKGRPTILVEEGAIFVARGGVLDCFDFHGQRRRSQPVYTGWTKAGMGISLATASSSAPGDRGDFDSW